MSVRSRTVPGAVVDGEMSFVVSAALASIPGAVAVGVPWLLEMRPSVPVMRSRVLPAPMCVRLRSRPKNLVELARMMV